VIEQVVQALVLTNQLNFLIFLACVGLLFMLCWARPAGGALVRSFFRLLLNLWTQYSENELEEYSIELTYLRQRCFDASKPRDADATAHGRPITMPVGFSRRNKILRCSAYDIAESNQVLASGLWSGSGSKVNEFVHVPTPVDTQNVIQIHARIFE